VKAKQTIKFVHLFAIVVLTGCVPVVYTTVPQISGRVVDASGASLENAVVKVRNASDAQPRFALSIPCDADGRFLHRAETRWGLYIAGEDNFGTHFQAQAFSGQSKSDPKAFGRNWSQARLFGLGTLDSVDLGDLIIPLPAHRPVSEN
jgi:hypothetical protein